MKKLILVYAAILITCPMMHGMKRPFFQQDYKNAQYNDLQQDDAADEYEKAELIGIIQLSNGHLALVPIIPEKTINQPCIPKAEQFDNISRTTKVCSQKPSNNVIIRKTRHNLHIKKNHNTSQKKATFYNSGLITKAGKFDNLTVSIHNPKTQSNVKTAAQKVNPIAQSKHIAIAQSSTKQNEITRAKNRALADSKKRNTEISTAWSMVQLSNLSESQISQSVPTIKVINVDKQSKKISAPKHKKSSLLLSPYYNRK